MGKIVIFAQFGNVDKVLVHSRVAIFGEILLHVSGLFYGQVTGNEVDYSLKSTMWTQEGKKPDCVYLRSENQAIIDNLSCYFQCCAKKKTVSHDQFGVISLAVMQPLKEITAAKELRIRLAHQSKPSILSVFCGSRNAD